MQVQQSLHLSSLQLFDDLNVMFVNFKCAFVSHLGPSLLSLLCCSIPLFCACLWGVVCRCSLSMYKVFGPSSPGHAHVMAGLLHATACLSCLNDQPYFGASLDSRSDGKNYNSCSALLNCLHLGNKKTAEGRLPPNCSEWATKCARCHRPTLVLQIAASVSLLLTYDLAMIITSILLQQIMFQMTFTFRILGNRVCRVLVVWLLFTLMMLPFEIPFHASGSDAIGVPLSSWL